MQCKFVSLEALIPNSFKIEIAESFSEGSKEVFGINVFLGVSLISMVTFKTFGPADLALRKSLKK